MDVQWLDRRTYFEDLHFGDTFVVLKVPYIRTDPDKCAGITAISLEDGSPRHFERSDIVDEANFKLVEIL